MGTITLDCLDDENRKSIDRIVGRFEESWKSESPAPLADFVPPVGDTLRLAALIELIKVEQEYLFSGGTLRQVEAYLTDWPELAADYDTVTALVRAECVTRAVLNEVPSLSEIEQRFSDCADQIDLVRVLSEAKKDRARVSSGPLAVGERYGRFTVESVLGTGAMGTVYEVFDYVLDRTVALKIAADEPGLSNRFADEARIAARLQHPNICPIFDVCELEGHLCIVMACITGHSLAELIRIRRFAPDEAAGLVQALARALHHAHAQGVIHRDIKPANVMIGGSGEPVLMDFGLAKQANAPPGSDAAFSGTPAYMAPEQLSDGDVDAQSDVYMLGVVFFELLTGRLPFSGPTVKEKIAAAEPLKPRDVAPRVPAELEAICLKAMARDAGNRYASAAEFAAALTQFLKSSRNSRTWLLRGVVVGMIVLVFLLFMQGFLANGGTTLQGVVWDDVNGNGAWDRPDEEGLGGWKVFLDDNRNGYWESDELFELTDDTGHYAFHSLPAESVAIGVVLSEGWEQTVPQSSLVQLDFAHDPQWVTNNPEHYLWDRDRQTYRITQTNIDRAGEYAYLQTQYNGHSFTLSWDIRLLSNDYASDVRFGLLDPDGNTHERGSYAVVQFTHVDAGHVVQIVCQDADDVVHAVRATKQFSLNTWYRVVLEYDADHERMDATVVERGSKDVLTTLSVDECGTFANDMARIGSSNVRSEVFQCPGNNSTAEIDNVEYSLSGPRTSSVQIEEGETGAPINFGNRKLGAITGAVWGDSNRSGVRDESEAGLPEMRVYIDANQSMVWDLGEQFSLTDAEGHFTIDQLSCGIHVLRLEVKEGFHQTVPADYDWQSYGGHQYAVTKQPGSWELCQAEAEAAGGHLVTINDAAENAWLATTFQGHFTDGTTHPLASLLWIGLRRRSGSWRWVSGEPVTFQAEWWDREREGPHTAYVYLHNATHPSPGSWLNAPQSSPHLPFGVIERTAVTPLFSTGYALAVEPESAATCEFGAAQWGPQAPR